MHAPNITLVSRPMAPWTWSPRWFGCAAIMIGGAFPGIGAAAQGPRLTGTWGGEQSLSPIRPNVTLTLARHGDRLLAVVGTDTSVGYMRRDSARVILPGGLGTLRIRQRTPASPPRVFWIEPPSVGPAYASPVRTVQRSPVEWTGTLRPTVPRFTLFLNIWRDSTDTLRGMIRNREANFGFGRPLTIAPGEREIALIDRASGRRRFVQPLDREQQTIRFDFGVPLILRPIDPDTARRYRARPANIPLRLTPAPRLTDGWHVAPPASVNVRPSALLDIVRRIAHADPSSSEAPRIHSLLVARRGVLVVDEYFYGYTEADLHDLRSASKTFTSVMVGTAMHARMPIDPHMVLTPGGATIAQLLTHTSGLACDDNDANSPGNEDRMQSQDSQPDWYRYTRALPQAYPPGTTYAYCSAGINLVGGAVAAASQRWLPEYFDEAIAQPLQIARFGMNLMPNGEGYSGGGLYLRPRDFLKLGELYRRGGRWGRQQIVDSAWVRTSTNRQQPVPNGADDGYAWHRHRLTVNGREVQAYEASGNGGQFVVVIPAFELVIGLTAEHFGEGLRWMALREEIIAAVAAAAR